MAVCGMSWFEGVDVEMAQGDGKGIAPAYAGHRYAAHPCRRTDGCYGVSLCPHH